MRFLFLLPDFSPSKAKIMEKLYNLFPIHRLQPLHSLLMRKFVYTDEVHGGDLNIMRHCWVAHNTGVDAVIATMSGHNSFGDRVVYDLPFVRWADRRSDDVCIIPDFLTEIVNDVKGQVIVYLQAPHLVQANFNYMDSRVNLWTDSPFMKEVCEKTYPGKDIEIIPNIVDCNAFPFIPQIQREAGLVFAFPRKNPEYIQKTQECYRDMGGKYWRFELVNGLPFHELAKQFRRPQVFLASAEIEGCALPPQESMAAGIVVVGRTAGGANFCMEHRKTAMNAETPEEAARCLLELEDAELRDRIALNARDYISRYFPFEEPAKLWQKTINKYKSNTKSLV